MNSNYRKSNVPKTGKTFMQRLQEELEVIKFKYFPNRAKL